MAFRVLFSVLFIGCSAFAQQNNLFVTEFNYVHGSTNTVGFQNSNATLKYPLKLQKGTLINSLEYTNYKVDYNDKLDEAAFGIETFKSIAYALKFNKDILNGWNYSISVSPTLASNFESKVSTDDLFINGGVVFTKMYAKNKLKLGVVRNLSYGFNSPIPVIAVEGSLNENLAYSVGFPITEFLYKVNNTNQFSLYAKPKGFYANIGNSVFVNVNDEVEKAQFQSYVSGLKFSHSIDENWKIEFDAGYQLKSEYNLLDKNLNSVYEFKTKNNFSAGVSLKFDLLNNKS